MRTADDVVAESEKLKTRDRPMLIGLKLDPDKMPIY